MTDTKHEKPKCKVMSPGPDGNAFAILSRVKESLKRAGLGHLTDEYTIKAMAGNYDHLIKVSLEYVEEE